jgi:phosphoglycerate dehydrogenase-like enzyme
MIAAVRMCWPEMHAVHLPNYDQLPRELADTDIFVGSSLRPDQLHDAKKLKWIHSTAAGVSQLLYPELRDSGVLLTNASGVFSVPMAEHAMGMLLALARNFPDAVRYQDQSRWAQQELWNKPQHFTELHGRVLLIVGLGSIGRELARRAHAFDMRVWGVTRSGTGESKHVEKIVAASQLQDVLPRADYVVLCAPETVETKLLIGAEQLQRMKRGARLVNVARGSLLDESTLIRALESGALGGAALDVAEVEPLPAESALWRAPNLFLTPHTSAVSDLLWERETSLLLDLLERWFDGREMLNLVDFVRGY